MTQRFVPLACLMLGLLAGFACHANTEYPPLSVEISDQHPLFIFAAADGTGATPESYAVGAARQWETLDEELRPFSVLRVMSRDLGPARTEWYEALLPLLQQAGIPVVMAVGEDDPQTWMEPADVKRLLLANTAVRGVETHGLRFDLYEPPLPGRKAASPKVTWLTGIIDVAAQYGRFTHIPLGGMNWPRAMANVNSTALYQKMVEVPNHVIPSGLYSEAHALARNGALMGLWLEGAVRQWGISANADWYREARYVKPGIYGPTDSAEGVPSSLYRAMVLSGAMAGASVFAFDNPESLWLGTQRQHWREAIQPTLTGLLKLGLVPRPDFVRKRLAVAYQMDTAATPPEFHRNMRDIDGILDAGLLLHGAYGMERPGQVWELIPNRGDYYLIPILSPHADEAVLKSFQRVVHPGEMNSPSEWESLLGRYRDITQSGEGSAFIATVGRGIFVLNTRENSEQAQAFALSAVPAPIRGLEARRQGTVIELTWPFREGDVSYNVYRRSQLNKRFELLAGGLEERRYVDDREDAVPMPPAGPLEEVGPGESRPILLEPALPEEDKDSVAPTVAYAITALTSEQEPFSGTVGYGEYLALSVVESRIAEQVVLHPLLSSAVSEPIPETRVALAAPTVDTRYVDVPEDKIAVAKAIAARVEQWDKAFCSEDLNGVMDLYATTYQDPQGWRSQYVRRAYQWFFERCQFPRMERQIRRWEFARAAETGEVNLLIYCRLAGVPLSSADGRLADPQMAIPRTGTSEVWVTWTQEQGVWRIAKTNPALPNFRELLSYAAGPYDNFPIGPDWLD